MQFDLGQATRRRKRSSPLTYEIRHGTLSTMSNGDTMTPKQSAFAGFVAEGDSLSEAYRKAYNTAKMSDNVVNNEASALAKNQKVKQAIESLKVQTRSAHKAHQKLSNDWIMQKLHDEAINEGNPAATRVRALELLGKTGGLFDESTHVTFEHRSPEDVEKELLEKLNSLFGAEA